MTRTKMLLTTGTMALLSAVTIAGCTSSATTPTQATDASASVTTESPKATPDVMADAPAEGTDAWVAWYALMGPEGEYAAAASYQAVIDEFGDVEPYVTIKNSEERHISALVRQLDRYGIEAPENPYLGEIDAPADLLSAAQAWAVGEVDNMDMYDDLLALTDDPTLERVLGNLQRASEESHLPLFELAADNGGTLTTEQMPTDLGAHAQGGGSDQAMHSQSQDADHGMGPRR